MMWGTGWGIWGFLMMAIFWGGLVVLVIFAFRGLDADRRRLGGGGTESPDASSILDERFAKGEISEDELEQKRNVLKHAAR